MSHLQKIINNKFIYMDFPRILEREPRVQKQINQEIGYSGNGGNGGGGNGKGKKPPFPTNHIVSPKIIRTIVRLCRFKPYSGIILCEREKSMLDHSQDRFITDHWNDREREYYRTLNEIE